MNENGIFLSICIPTYNEAKYLENTINSIIVQKEFINKSVEIIIADNSSNDGTDTLLSKYINKYNNIIYIKNDKNIGSTNNTILAVSKARGMLIKISTSSTMFSRDSLKIIFDYINKYKNSNIQLYFSNVDLKNDQLLNFKNFTEITSINNTNYLTWSIWKSDINDYLLDHKYDYSYIPACYFNLKYTYKYGNALIINKNLFTQQQRTPKYLKYGLYNVFGRNIYDIHNYFIKIGALDISFLKKLKKKLGYWFVNWVIVFEFKDKNYVYSEFENLKSDFITGYKSEKYFFHLYFYYTFIKIKYLIIKIKDKIL